MVVKIRLMRMGRRNRVFYRIVAADARSQRDGRAIERLGYYDPLVSDDQKKISLSKDRIEYWLGVGAQPTVTVENILRSRGVKFPERGKQRKARTERRKAKSKAQKGKPKAKMSLRKAKKGGARKPAAKKSTKGGAKS